VIANVLALCRVRAAHDSLADRAHADYAVTGLRYTPVHGTISNQTSGTPNDYRTGGEMADLRVSPEDGGVLQYEHVQDQKFALVVEQWNWIKNSEFGGLVLQGGCPVCGHDHAIDVFVPTEIAAFGAGSAVSPEYVECACDQDHRQPAGKSGCGRWAWIRPRVVR
jgi:hypothetical protein